VLSIRELESDRPNWRPYAVAELLTVSVSHGSKHSLPTDYFIYYGADQRRWVGIVELPARSSRLRIHSISAVGLVGLGYLGCLPKTGGLPLPRNPQNRVNECIHLMAITVPMQIPKKGKYVLFFLGRQEASRESCLLSSPLFSIDLLRHLTWSSGRPGLANDMLP